MSVCNAEWIEVGRIASGSVTYIDDSKITRLGDQVTVLEMQNWVDSSRGALSVIEEITYNCSTKTRQRNHLTAYSGRSARGSVVLTSGEANPTEVRAGSMAAEAYRLTCNDELARPKESPKRSGSGFFVSSVGHIITNAHVVRNASRITAVDLKGQEYSVKRVAVDERLDLALLKIEPVTKTEGLKFADFSKIEKGQKIYTIGYPNPSIQGLESKITDGIISSLSGLNGESTQMQVSAPVQPGNSGGPMVNEKGEVVGVIVARLDGVAMLKQGNQLIQNVNYAISGDLATRFIRMHVPDQHRKTGLSSLTKADNGTVLIKSE